MQTSLKLLFALTIGAAAGVGATLALTGDDDARSGRTAILTRLNTETISLKEDNAALLAELERLRALLAAKEKDEPNPYPNDSIEMIDELLQEAYEDNNVDWLLEVIERLLLMGEDGYPALRSLLMDIIFRAKFLPRQSDFRFDQLYRAGRIFTEHERQFIGFINFLLVDPQTNPWFKQGAMVAGAWFVGSKAPGSDELQQTLLQAFLAQSGGGLPSNMLMGNMGKRMQVFAIAMSGDPKMIEPLRDELTNTKDKKLQGDIIGALAYLGDPKALPLIQDRLDPNSKDDYRREIRALARLGTEEAEKTAVQFVRSIGDGKRFYRHAAHYVRSGGGNTGVQLIKERVQSQPDDPEVQAAIGTLRRYPTEQSHETLVLISQSVSDPKVAERAANAAADVDRKLKGIIPEPPK
ncbi:MAG: HEAT repeat domain-containing protein [Planctomycetota bacterium]